MLGNVEKSENTRRPSSQPEKIDNRQLKQKKIKIGPEMFFNKLRSIGESFLSKFPIKKIVPILKRNENHNYLWIVFFAMKFVKVLKEKTFVAKYKKLNDHHFKMINDNSKVVGIHDKLSHKITKNQRFNFRKKVIILFYIEKKIILIKSPTFLEKPNSVSKNK